MKADAERTRQFYAAIKADDLCSCNYCKNYYLQVKETYPLVSDYLADLGVDIEKPFETSPLEPDEHGILEYCVCQYIVLGNTPCSFTKRMGEVTIDIATSYPNTHMQQDHFVLDVYPIKLKWIM